MLCLLSLASSAQTEAKVPSAGVSGYDSLRYALICVAILLLFVIGGLANVTGITARLFVDKQKKQETSDAGKPVLPLLLLGLLLPALSMAQDKSAAAAVSTFSLPEDIWFYFVAIGVELLVVFALVRIIYTFTKIKKEVVAKAPAKLTVFQKIIKPQAAEEEARLDLNHDYDGIRELDNNIPGWWKVAFFATFMFAIVYMYRLYGSETMPNQLQELAMSNEAADLRKLEYLKEAANNIDENNVKMLGVDDIAAGRELFTKNCVACHGDRAQGGVGPNLTDDHWLHKGSIHDIFYSIKYGWQEKGMKSWKEDFSPQQIAQLASFIKTVANTNVEGGKEAQGELYVDVAAVAAADSSGSIKTKNN
ncbi:cbb3-type cytochrome c oxidase N-terminal domain-containing protein [Ferruginibacter sp. HRS2-29]|uniref:cbb3-type cytochrome c oxidase N-terminal domain-containing protein n=1 Tax=Ferruginibacter sp. HRS2-29 TaxID=2487334 RepID=UPI0020CF8FB9|nr:cbb3-type cytochrome c oxidase N-terminal domain-containing protein [Ferruginibacter sp. HRS2-29]